MNKSVPNRLPTNGVHLSKGLQIASRIGKQNLEIPYIFQCRACDKLKLSLKSIIDFVFLNQTRVNRYILYHYSKSSKKENEVAIKLVFTTEPRFDNLFTAS